MPHINRQLPEALQPCSCFPEKELSKKVFCPNCKKVFPICSGVVYFGVWETGGDKKIGNLTFCSLLCLLVVLEPEGNG